MAMLSSHNGHASDSNKKTPIEASGHCFVVKSTDNF